LAAPGASATQSAAIAAAPLGLSGADLLAIVLVVVVLAGLSVLTARLARRSR
jgi:hypothetical protein